jgi:hypothetical protein
VLKMGCAYLKGKLSKSQSSPDKPRTKARRRVAMFPNPEMVLLAAVVGEATA